MKPPVVLIGIARPKILVIPRGLIFYAGMKSGLASFLSSAALLLGIWCGLATVAQAKTPPPDDKWRIVCMRDALSDGVIVFRLTSVGAAPQEFKVPIKDGTYENEIARQVRDVFRANLHKDLYHVETDDGEAVLVKKKRGAANFQIEFVSNSVNGVGIRVELD